MFFLFRRIRSALINKNKVWKYLAYAIGEIFLVVIGIYIAIQFNNWNEGKRNQRLIQTNIGILIENLQKDSISMAKSIEIITERIASNELIKKRLNQESANLDTLVKIVRFEFSPKIHGVTFANDDAYQAMNQLGEINLMEKHLRQDVFGLYSRHDELLAFYRPKLEKYIETLMDFHSKYGLQETSTFKEGPIAEAKWKKATMNDLAQAFDPLMLTKMSLYNLGLPRIERIYVETQEVLNKLRKAQNDQFLPQD